MQNYNIQAREDIPILIPDSQKETKSPFLNVSFEKNNVKELVSWFLKFYGEKKTIHFLESLKYTGFHQATKAGISLGIEDLEIPPDKPNLITQAYITTRKIEQENNAGSLTSVEKSQYLIDTWNQTSDTLRQNAVQNFRTRNSLNPVYMMAFSGARGNISQVRQLVAMRGLMADPQGAILEFPIQSNFREGLTITEYLISCYGARKGLVDTALRTATSGYLTRRLVDSAQQAVVSMIDCGTQQGILIENKNLESRLVGRILAKSYNSLKKNQLISPEIAKSLAKNYQQIAVRSPLTCEASTSVCQFCYGWNLASGKLVQIGEAVGVIAAQSIGEPGTQLTMRTFHTGGVGVFSDQALKPIFAPYEGKIVFEDSLPGHFVRTPHGKIVYMVKYTNTNSDRIVFRLLPSTKTHREFLVREQDLPSGSLLLVKNGEIVNIRQLLAQASHVKLTKQKLPESSHPVYSPLEGQIFFESMNLAIEKEIATDLELSKKKIDLKNNIFINTKLNLPDVRRMTKIGSFWVFSAFNQYEIHTTECFVEPGDLVSKNTLLFNYDFHSPSEIQIKKYNSKLLFGVDTFQIPIQTISFSKNFYKFTINKRDQEQLIYQKQNQEFGVFCWYLPEIVNSARFAPGKLNKLQSLTANKTDKFLYTHISPFYTQRLSFPTETQKFLFQLPKGQVFQVLSLTNTHLKNFSITRQKKFNNKTSKIFKYFPFITKNNKLISYQTNFLSQRLAKKLMSKNIILNYIKLQITKTLKVSGWVYIPSNDILTQTSYLDKQQFLPSGLCFENICFPKQNISLKMVTVELNYLLRKTNSSIVSKQNENFKNQTWYCKNSLLKTNFSSSLLDKNLHQVMVPNSYKIQNSLQGGLIWYKFQINSTITNPGIVNSASFAPGKLNFQKIIHTYKSNSKGILFQQLCEYSYPTQTYFTKKISNFVRKRGVLNPNHFLFSKQFSTSINFDNNSKLDCQFLNTTLSDWLSNQNGMRIQFKAKTNSSYPNFYNQYQTTSNTLERGLNIFQYTHATFKNLVNPSFISFINNWVVPAKSFSSGVVKVKLSGEFRYKTSQTTGTCTSIIRIKDLIKLQRNPEIGDSVATAPGIGNSAVKDPGIKDSASFAPGCSAVLAKSQVNNFSLTRVGNIIRWGQPLSLECASSYNGQIMNKTSTTVTVRLGVPILASTRGIVNVFQNDLVKQNQLLITLKSRRLQTEDIVQGIPKIEQLFEARESQGGEILSDTVHMRLRSAFVRELELLNNEHWSRAVEKSFLAAQNFLVENILEAYSNQGVKIAEKHVEVIARQMTSRVRILEPGETGLLPGELVQHSWIQKFNKHIRDIGLREATYEPIVLGISKSVLQSDSFLLAASFQEVSRVLVRSALAKKRDFLRGLHENVIVGQLIPAGTGLLNQYTEAYPQLKK